MVKQFMPLFSLILAVLFLTACSSNGVSKAEEAYSNGDYKTVVNLVENMKKADPDALALLNKARIHLAFESGNYNEVLELAGNVGADDEEISSLIESAKDAVEAAESAGNAQIVGSDEVPKAEVELDVDAAYSIDGQTHYSLSKQEYDQLLSDVNRKIDDELNSYNKASNFAGFPHFESVTSNEDRTKFTIVINDGNFDSASELALPDQLAGLARMYAQYNQKSISKITIEYRTMLGDLLNESTINIPQGAASAENQASESDAPVSESPQESVSGNGLSFTFAKSVSSIVVGNMYQLSCAVQVSPEGGASDVYSYKYDVLQDGQETQSSGWIGSNQYNVDLSGTGTCVLRISVQDSAGNVSTQDADLLER